MNYYYLRLSIITIYSIFIIMSPTLAEISSDLVLSNDENCGSLTTNSSILAEATLTICDDWDYVFFGGKENISVFAKSDLKKKTSIG